MKKTLSLGAIILSALLSYAQQKQGKIIFERVENINKPSDNPAESFLLHTWNDKFELYFADNKSLWKEDLSTRINADTLEVDGAITISTRISPIAEAAGFMDFSSKRMAKPNILDGKKIIVEDNIPVINWKLEKETSNILNHICRKATATETRKKVYFTTTNNDPAVLHSEVVTDNLTAWFTDDIPVPGGPDYYQGQLPGLILSLDITGDQTVSYRAIAISNEVNFSDIKKPAADTTYTLLQFEQISNKLMEEKLNQNR